MRRCPWRQTGVELVSCLFLFCLCLAYLVGLLGSLGTLALDGLRDVVGGVLNGLHSE